MEAKVTYKSAGIDVNETDAAKRAMGAIITDERNTLNRFGAFASLIKLDTSRFSDPVLVMKTEEPGSKQLLAFEHDRVESVCADMINHLVNDCIVMGAEPLAVQDAIICGKFDKDLVLRAVRAMSDACKDNECALVGGETSVQPGVLGPGVYVLTSSIIGLVDRAKIVDGQQIRPGDSVIAVASNGLHTNGYTLVRALMKKNPALAASPVGGTTFLEAILKVHTPYYRAFKPLIQAGKLTGMAHITGGGIADNLARVLPGEVDAEVDLGKVKTLPVFSTIRKEASLEDAEMLRTFNCGVGMVLVARSGDAAAIVASLASSGLDSYAIGTVVAGSGKVRLEGRVSW